MASARATANHETIRRWVDERDGIPAHVKATARGDDPGILRIDFPGFSGEHTLERLSWDQFFDWFERNDLAFLYQDDSDSRFNKLVSRRNVKLQEGVADRASESDRDRMNAVKLLEQQHREVEALFEEYEQAGSAQDKLRTFEWIADRLAAHTRIEEEIFYPSVYGDDTEGELREAVEEHLAIKRVIADLLEMEPSDEQFDAKVTVMKELVEHHVAEEENKLFSMIEDIGTDALVDMGERMCDLYLELMQEEPRTNVPHETASAAQL